AVTQGNPDLEPEISDTYSAGLVIRSPSASPLLSRLQASIDYYNIKISDAIGTLPFATGLARCFNADGSNPNYDPANVNCSVVARNQEGRIADALIPTLNLAQYQTTGI